MERKRLKFRDVLAELVLKGEKDTTWRLFDDKDISKNDVVDLVNWNTGEKFGEADVLHVYEKELQHLTEDDYQGHERFESDEKMYETYRLYYGDRVRPDTIVKIIRFKLR